MEHLTFFSFLALTSIVFALLEINVEGKEGWAKNLPTKKIDLSTTPFFKIFYSGSKMLTGYHLCLWLLLFLLSHTYILFLPMTWVSELKALSFYILLLTSEDFLWFILNPHYGINKFSKNNIVWHSSWTLGLPTAYWLGFPAGLTLYILSQAI